MEQAAEPPAALFIIFRVEQLFKCNPQRPTDPLHLPYRRRYPAVFNVVQRGLPQPRHFLQLHQCNSPFAPYLPQAEFCHYHIPPYVYSNPSIILFHW